MNVGINFRMASKANRDFGSRRARNPYGSAACRLAPPSIPRCEVKGARHGAIMGVYSLPSVPATSNRGSLS
jgi:hypothetical protein